VSEVLYSERAIRPWAWRLAWAILALVAIVPALIDPSDGDRSLPNLALNIVAYGLTWAIPVWIALLTMWSIDRYGTITLTRETLTVGRESIPVQQLAPPGVPTDGAVRRFGGSYRSTAGRGSIVLVLRDGSGISFDVRDPQALLRALTAVHHP